MKRTLILSAILACCLGACEYQKFDDVQNPETGSENYFGKRLDCSVGVCTAVFASVDVNVQNAAGLPVALNSFVVTDRAGKPLPVAANGMAVYGKSLSGEGSYTVLNDAWVTGHQGLGSSFYAKGFLSGVLAFNETYKISADCCHVSRISGKDRIIVP
jgi:hypothetical protein